MGKEINEILDSGLMESYLMGLCSDAERKEFEGYLDKYPEIQKAYKECEGAIEKMADENAVTPAESIKTSLLEKIRESNNAQASSKSTNSLKWLLGMASVFLLGALLWGWNMRTSFNDLNSKHDQLLIDCEEEKNRSKEPIAQLELIKHHQTQTVILNGAAFNTNAEVIVFWNPNYDYGLMDIESLPKLDDNQCFQIWADKDGKMISRGIFDFTDQFVKIDFLENAESLNITVEPKGGNDHPTVERLVANGLIS